MAAESLEPFPFFTGEATHDEMSIRKNAMEHVVHVASLMDHGDVRADLLPFLKTRLNDHDQILTILAGKIGDLFLYIGGVEWTPLLIELLEPLCACEESYVRDAAASSIDTMLTLMMSVSGDSLQPIKEYLLVWACMCRLTDTEANDIFYPRYTVGLCLPTLYGAIHKCEGMAVPMVPGDEEGAEASPPTTYENVGALKAAVNALFTALQTDEISIVRSACARVFMKLVNAVEVEMLSDGILESLRIFLKDDCPPIRICVIEQIPLYATKLKELGEQDVIVSEVLPIIRNCVTDESWRIRLAIAKHFAAFVDSIGAQEVISDLYPLAIQLLQDSEPDVRQAILEELLPFVDVVPADDFMKAFMSVADFLVDDPIPQVRKLLATLAVGIATKLASSTSGGDAANALVMRMISDEDPMIRMRILKQLDKIAECVPTLATNLADTLKEMFTDSNWRVRQEIIQAMPAIISNLGVDFFEGKFVAEFLGMLRDSVDEVRTATAATLCKIVPLVGMDWAYEKIFQAVRPMSNADFLLRLSMLSALQGLLQSDLPPGESFQSECLALVVAATNDRVPNVRMKAAQVLSDACNLVGPDISRNHIRPVLNDLQGDADRDVAFFATEGMKLCT